MDQRVNWIKNVGIKTRFGLLINTVKWIRWLTGTKFKFPKWSVYQYSTILPTIACACSMTIMIRLLLDLVGLKVGLSCPECSRIFYLIQKSLTNNISHLSWCTCPKVGSPLPPPLLKSRPVFHSTPTTNHNLLTNTEVSDKNISHLAWCTCPKVRSPFLLPSWSLDQYSTLHPPQPSN